MEWMINLLQDLDFLEEMTQKDFIGIVQVNMLKIQEYGNLINMLHKI
jgi:hypothetical protein